jgi:hypothetical protein
MNNRTIQASVALNQRHDIIEMWRQPENVGP